MGSVGARTGHLRRRAGQPEPRTRATRWAQLPPQRWTRQGTYHASKWALEALSQALAEEVEVYGIRVTLVEPLTFPSALGSVAPPMPEYDQARAKVLAGFVGTGIEPGDPVAAGRALLALVDDPNPPLRALFGAHGLALIRPEYERRIADWEQGVPLAELAQGMPPRGDTQG